MSEITQADRGKWRNIWCILRALDRREIIDAPGFEWDKFRDNPHAYVICTDQDQANAIWAAVEKRLK